MKQFNKSDIQEFRLPDFSSSSEKDVIPKKEQKMIMKVVKKNLLTFHRLISRT